MSVTQNDFWTGVNHLYEEEPLDLHRRPFTYAIWLDRIRTISQYNRKSRPCIPQDEWVPGDEPNERKGVERWLERTPEAAALWREIHKVNGLKVSENSIHEQECLTGRCGPIVEWSHCIPYNEAYIVAMMIWLRETGASPSDPALAELEKVSIGNVVPTLKWMGQRWEYHYGGLILAPTKKCLWRLCIQAMSTLYDAAVSKVPFHKFKATQLTKDWATTIMEPGILKTSANPNRGEFHMGEKYFSSYGDYSQDQLSVTATVDANTMTTNIYEYRYLLIKNRYDRPIELIPRDLEQHSQSFVWSEDREGKRVIPQKAAIHTTRGNDAWSVPTTEIEILERGGPTLFVGLEPVKAVLMFWHSVRRLIAHESYTIGDGEFEDTMQLADLFLRLCQCTKPSQLYDVKIPKFIEEKLSKPDNCDQTARESHRKVDEEQLSIEDMWIGRYEKHPYKDFGDKNASASPATSQSSFTWPSSPSTTHGASGKPALVWCQHTDRQETMRQLEDELTYLCLKKQRQFDGWVKEYGLSEALERQRMQLPESQDADIPRVWQEYQQIGSEDVTCKKCCFDDIKDQGEAMAEEVYEEEQVSESVVVMEEVAAVEQVEIPGVGLEEITTTREVAELEVADEKSTVVSTRVVKLFSMVAQLKSLPPPALYIQDRIHTLIKQHPALKKEIQEILAGVQPSGDAQEIPAVVLSPAERTRIRKWRVAVAREGDAYPPASCKGIKYDEPTEEKKQESGGTWRVKEGRIHTEILKKAEEERALMESLEKIKEEPPEKLEREMIARVEEARVGEDQEEETQKAQRKDLEHAEQAEQVMIRGKEGACCPSSSLLVGWNATHCHPTTKVSQLDALDLATACYIAIRKFLPRSISLGEKLQFMRLSPSFTGSASDSPSSTLPSDRLTSEESSSIY